MDLRRTITFTIFAVLFVLTYQWAYNKLFPLPPAAAPQNVATNAPTGGPAENPSGGGNGPAAMSSQPAPIAMIAGGATNTTTTLGGGTNDSLLLKLTPRGAAVAEIKITEVSQRKPGQYVHREGHRGNEPYEIVGPVYNGEHDVYSFATRSLKIEEWGRDFNLSDVLWEQGPTDATRATYTATLRASDGNADLLRLTKTYELIDKPDKPYLVKMSLRIDNAGSVPLTPIVEQDGAVGIQKDDEYRDQRQLMWARYVNGALEFKHATRKELAKQIADPRRLDGSAGNERLVWAAVVSKFFGVFVRPLESTQDATSIAKVVGTVAAPNLADVHDDALARFVIKPPATLAPGASATIEFEVYAGPKDGDILARTNPAFSDRTQIGYIAAGDIDQSCCTFQPLPKVMTWLLETIHLFIGNYGIAIMILVLIVRGLLHPLAVWQQKQMYRSQDAMARIQPKVDLILEKFPDDKLRQNQERMRLMAEEGINPAAMMVGMLPMFIQLPIMVALWTALSTDIHMRNAPFDGWWIVDLSAPDALIRFSGDGIDVPLLSMMMGKIHSLNVLPIVMGITMYLQQKYMPKPAQIAKREIAADAAKRRAASGGMSADEQARINQTTANIMCILFPVMMYSMPSGLTLYWMATNVFGIFESLRIRKQIREEKERKEREGPPPPSNKRGWLSARLSRFYKYLAEQAEELQKQADEASGKKGKPKEKERDKDKARVVRR